MRTPTPLGMPRRGPAPQPPTDPTWKQAWDRALYGPDGFFRREAPGAHFRTSVHASPLFAEAVVGLVRAAGLDTLVDIGAGRGELLTEVHRRAPELDLLAVEVAPRPAELPAAIAWTAALPAAVEGVVLANEWLDNIPCHVVETGAAGQPVLLHVDPATGAETPGLPLRDPAVPPSLGDWLDRWWPLPADQPGRRAEIGTTRDAAWADVVGRVTRGLAVAVDYGHTRADRPWHGSLRSYRDGREVDVLPDGSRDVTAPVAVDAVAARAGGYVVRQRDALHALGVSGARPDLVRATRDPRGYLADLARAGEAAELTATGGLGDFFWVVTRVGDVADPLAAPRPAR